MKKKWNRVKAMLMAVVMMLAMALPGGTTAWAETAITTATLKVTNVEAGATVYAYPIVQAAANDDDNIYWNMTTMISNYFKTNGTTDGKYNSFTETQLITIYTNLNSSTASDNHDGKGSATIGTVLSGKADSNGIISFTNVLPGLYVICAELDGGTYSYNFSVAAVNYTYEVDGTASISGADADGVYTYAVKRSDNPTITKTTGTDGKIYADASIGDTVSFTIKIAVPDYDESWVLYESAATNMLHYYISDTLSAGLTLDTTSVKINGTSISDYLAGNGSDGKTIASTGSTISYNTDGSGFVLNLYGYAVYDLKAADITLTYNATVTSDAGVNFDSETNTAALKYTTAANSDDLSEITEVTTYHYTFGFDTTLNGTGSGSTTSSEITKYGVKTNTTSGSTEAVELEGAEFQLSTDEAGSNALKFTSGVYDATSGSTVLTTDEDGLLSVRGLDAGTYYLKETKAPEGYTLDSTVYKIVITPTYNETTGALSSYKVEITNQTDASNTLTFTHSIDSSSSVTTQVSDNSSTTFSIKNTALTNLPETGGMGIVLVTIAAVVMMVLFGTAFMALKKKKKS